MLTSVVDRTGRGEVGAVRRAFEDVAHSLAAKGLRVEWPVAVEIVAMPIMGATKSAGRTHTLYVSLDAARSNALDGLLAHEMGHMIRTETHHPSHDPAVYKAFGTRVRVPRAALGTLGEAFNHVQDIYADDLAFLGGFDGRAYEFFRVWIEGNSERRGRDPWENVMRSVTNGFALGNLKRHGLLGPEDPLWSRARDFDRRTGLHAVDEFAEFFATLPESATRDRIVDSVTSLADSIVRARRSRTF